MEAWLTQLAWASDGSGFGSSPGSSATLEKVAINEHSLFAKLVVHGWAPGNLPHVQKTWVNLTLAFETQTHRQNLDTVNAFSPHYGWDHRYQPGVGKAVWSVIRRCASLFPQTLVYCTNEA